MLKKFIQSKWYKKYIWNERKSGSFKNINIFLESFNNKALYQRLYYKIYHLINNIIEFPRNSYRAIKRGIQRGYRGWANEDVWGLGGYLAKVITESCLRLKNTKHGVPMSCFEDKDEIDETGNFTDASLELADKRWNSDLDKIINTFHIANLIFNHNYVYIPTKNWNEDDYKKMVKTFSDGETIVMTYEDCLKYEEGFDLFKKHFHSLWD